MLQRVFDPRTRLTVIEAEGTTQPEPGWIYLCPGGEHCYFSDRKLVVSKRRHDEKFQPSIDLLFRTLAEEFGPKGIAVVMSGMLDDGTEGAKAIYEHGSVMLVQSPEELPCVGAQALDVATLALGVDRIERER